MEKRIEEMPSLCGMNGGVGPNSYVHNSSIQRGNMDATKEALSEEIVKNLDTKQFSRQPRASFHVADFGCSTGPNTFEAMQVIVDSVKLKFSSQKVTPEFQVSFSDLVSNDFNTLFSLLPPKRKYYALGVPGSFHGRLFPKASLHFAYSSSSLNWLSKVPENALDKDYKEMIHYSSDKGEVSRAYYWDQFRKDLNSFLNARATELVDGGLMCLVLPGVENEISVSQSIVGYLFATLGTCLKDMAKMGLIDEGKVDNFNIPVYYPTSKEMETVIKENGCFNIERMEIFSPGNNNFAIARLKMAASSVQAALEGLVAKHFGNKITYQLFQIFSLKVPELACSSLSSDIKNASVLFFFLKRAKSVNVNHYPNT